jgi:hypothetical protein
MFHSLFYADFLVEVLRNFFLSPYITTMLETRRNRLARHVAHMLYFSRKASSNVIW